MTEDDIPEMPENEDTGKLVIKKSNNNYKLVPNSEKDEKKDSVNDESFEQNNAIGLDDDYLPPTNLLLQRSRHRERCQICCLILILAAVLLLCAIGIASTILRGDVIKFYDRYLKPEAPSVPPDSFLDQYSQGFSWQSSRLPIWFKPTVNKLSIRPKEGDEWRHSFLVSNEISFEVLNRSRLLVLHFAYDSLRADNISCTHKHTNEATSPPVSVVRTTFSADTLAMYAFEFSRTLETLEKCSITLSGEGKIQTSSEGWFYDDYFHSKTTNSSNTEREISYALVTQLESVSARKVFPCFDEPIFKSKFSLSVTFHTKTFDFALFNSPVESETLHEGSQLKTVKFKETVLMPTYVVAIILAKNYGYVSMTTPETELRNYSVIHTVYYPKDLEAYAMKPLQLAIDSMLYFEKAFGIGFPMKKCDHFPVENLKLFGMENWGLITYSLFDFLYKSEDFGLQYELLMVNVVAHEMAHQWFGNLVTLEWWDELWLNEGFATFMGELSLQETRPQYNLRERFYTDGKLLRGLHMDAFEGTHPIYTASDSGSFDTITYWKSCGVLSMLEDFMGNDLFLAGVGQYLQKFKFGNAKEEDLWNMLTEASNNSVGSIAQIMDQWINQGHIPLVFVSFDDEKLYLEQRLFCYTCDTSEPHIPWSIPLTYAFSDESPGVSHLYVFDRLKAEIRLNRSEAERPEWIKVNINGTGIYRVLYSNEGALKTFSRTILSESSAVTSSESMTSSIDVKLPYKDRGNLMIDALALAKTGYVSYTDALEFVSSVLDVEDNEGAIRLAFDCHFGLVDLFQRLKRNGYELLVRNYVVKYLGKFYPGIEAETWSREEQDFNNYLLSFLCEIGYQKCLDDCNQLFQDWVDSDGELFIHPYIKDVFFPTMSRFGTLSQWEYMYQKASNGPKESFNLYQLWKTWDSNLIRRLLSEQFFANNVISSETTRILNALYQSSKNNLQGSFIVWDLVKTHWDALYDAYGHMDLLGEALETIVTNFDTLGQLEELKIAGEKLRNFEKNSFLGRGEEIVNFNIRWTEKYLNETVSVLSRLVSK